MCTISLSKKSMPVCVRPSLWLNLLLISALFFGSCSLFITKQEPVPTGIVDADDPNIQYIGRFYTPDPKHRVFDWPGVQICAKFLGTSCSIRLTDKSNEYAVIVDHRAPRILTIDSTIDQYCVASGLSDSLPHSIVIQKRTEPLVGKGIFCGFILDKGRTLLPLEKRPERRIEFIGNSITSGYGVEGDSPDCHFSPQTENACMSYASMTARELNADYHLISYSGRGVVRNYGDSSTTSIDPMPALYDRVFCSDTIHKWNFSSWVPQVVVINLGTNDFSTQPYPPKNIFQEAYVKIIDRVRSQYPGITIFCVCGPMIAEPCTGYILEVVEQQQKRSRDKDVFFVEVKPDALDKIDWGCDRHPNILGMSKISDILSRAIKIRLCW
jgi:lysophospholipase L1-like esterase